MTKQKERGVVIWILSIIPVFLIVTVLFLIHTNQTISVQNFLGYAFASENNGYETAEEGDGVLKLSVPSDAETLSDIDFTFEEKLDVYPSIMGIHFRHDAFYGEDYGVYNPKADNYTYTLTGRYFLKSALVLRQYELFFQWVLGAVLFLYLLFLLDIRVLNKEKKNRWGLRLAVVVLLAAAACALNDGFNYLHDNFSYVSFNELIYHYHTNLGGANFSEFSGLALKILMHVAAVVLAAVLYTLLKRIPAVRSFFEKHRIIDLLISWAAAGAAFLFCLLPITGFLAYFNVFDYLAARHIPSMIFDKYYVEPSEVTITFPEKKKNLIYIYVESMEITPSGKEYGGIETTDLIPDLTRLAMENCSFNGSGDTLNGGNSLSGSTWTIAGMVAQSAGLPVKMDGWNSNDADMFNSFLPGATSIGDILAEEGYHNVLLIGSDKRFGNRDDYFGMHGNYEMCDYYWAIETGRIPSDYKVWWGFEDKKLFQYAKEKCTELASEEGNFNLTMLTADTHFVDGYVCDLCGNEFDRQYANVLRCANNQISEFVSWVQEQEWGKDTVIVLSGDHLYMDSTFYDNKPDVYVRKTYVNILNSEKPEPDEWKEYCTMDLFPTTLSALGCEFEGDRLALGTDIYSETPSLLVELGEDVINDELELYSEFYEQKLMLGKRPEAAGDK